VFSPVAGWNTMRTILSIAAAKSWEVYQLDIKSAFLHGKFNKNVYLSDYQKGGKDKVYKLKNVLNGLRQAPRAWYNKIEAYFYHENFEKCPHEHTLFVK
jgi:hypothetical protein